MHGRLTRYEQILKNETGTENQKINGGADLKKKSTENSNHSAWRIRADWNEHHGIRI